MTQLPYGVMKGGADGFVAQVAALVRDARISGITGLEDRSSHDEGMRVVGGRAGAAAAGSIDGVVRDELRALAARFGDPRRTEIRG